MMTSRHSFSVSEVFEDGRVMVFTYARFGNVVNVLMQVYEPGLKNPTTAMNMTMPAQSGRKPHANG